ncbi:endonuclease/exonuclease/phosphatase family protein [bacterium]|nr:endonuclease/exonuclease/phosphatase family protein [bacterium]
MKRPLILLALLLAAVTPARAAAPGCPTQVLSFNIRYGAADDGPDSWSRRRYQVRLAMRDADADLIGLQECLPFQADELAAAFGGYLQVGAGRDDGDRAGEMCAVMVRGIRYEILDSGHAWLSETPERPGPPAWDAACTRMLTWVLLHDRFCEPDTFVFANTHLDHVGAEARAKAARVILDVLAEVARGRPVLLTGDFNAPAGDSKPWRILTDPARAAVPLRDAWLAADRRDLPSDQGTFHGFGGTPTRGRIDWILADPVWRVVWAGADTAARSGRWPSDHFPVAAELRGAWRPGVDRIDAWTGASPVRR